MFDRINFLHNSTIQGLKGPLSTICYLLSSGSTSLEALGSKPCSLNDDRHETLNLIRLRPGDL